MAQFSDLVDQTLLRVEASVGCEVVRFVLDDGRAFQLLHHQDCCEGVELVDLCGDLEDLRDARVVIAREESNDDQSGRYESATWTFYILQTTKGTVAFRWLGTSNGYYSEGVSFEETQTTQEERALVQAATLNRHTERAGGRRGRNRL